MPYHYTDDDLRAAQQRLRFALADLQRTVEEREPEPVRPLTDAEKRARRLIRHRGRLIWSNR